MFTTLTRTAALGALAAAALTFAPQSASARKIHGFEADRIYGLQRDARWHHRADQPGSGRTVQIHQYR